MFCQKYAAFLQNVRRTSAKNTPHFCQTYAVFLPNIRRMFAKNTAYFCQQYAVLLPKIRHMFAKNIEDSLLSTTFHGGVNTLAQLAPEAGADWARGSLWPPGAPDCRHPKKVSSRLHSMPTSRNYVEKPYAEPSFLDALRSGWTPKHEMEMRFVRVKRR